MRSILRVSVLFGSFFVFSSGAFCEERLLPRIILTVPDTLIPATQRLDISINLDNLIDTLEGFQFVLKSSRPDLAKFLFYDSAFNPNFRGFDTTGTLTAKFDYLQAIDRAGDGSEIWFRCIADLPLQEQSTPPIAPQQGGVGARFRMRLYPPKIPGDNVVELTIVKPFDFSDPYGVSIGVVSDTTWDTLWLDCQSVSGDSCTTWGPCVDSLSCDSVQITMSRHSYLDTTQVVPNHGSLILRNLICDNDATGKVDIVDLLCLVNYMFQDYNQDACPIVNCDANKSGAINIVDLTYLVRYLFQGGPPPL